MGEECGRSLEIDEFYTEMRNRIIELIRAVAGGKIEFSVEPVENPAFGHYATNVGMRVAALRAAGKSPSANRTAFEVARELAAKIKASDKEGFFDRVEAAPPGFINFWLSKRAIQESFKKVEESRKSQSANRGMDGTVVIDYSHPNIAKPMSVAHLRSTIIGDALYRIFKFAGWETISDNHLGDWGKQFGVLIAAYKEQLITNNLKLITRKITIEDLLKLYVDYSARMKTDPTLDEQARKETKKLQDGDRENTKIWKEFYEVSLAEFKKIYEILGVTFDYYWGESFYKDMLRGVVEDALKKGVAKESEGAVVIPLEGFETPFVIQKSDEAFLYSTTDLAAIMHRNKKFKPNLVLYVVDNGQSLHFTQLFKAGELLGLTRGEKLVHVKFGLMLGEDMKKLSTRAGKHIVLEAVLDEAVKKAHEVVLSKRPDLSENEREKIAQAVGIAAVKYNDLSQNRQSDIAFHWDKMLNLEGNSAPYLMYTYARFASILREAREERGERKEEREQGIEESLKTESEITLVLKLIQFPDVIQRITEDYFPHHLTDYLFELAKEANSFYHREPVLKAEADVRTARLQLVSRTAAVLKTGLNLLGIEALEKM